MRRTILTLVGVLAIIAGLLFMLQGFGVIRYPASSMMIDNSIWITRGAVIAALGALVVAGMRVVPVRRRRR
jgi:ABC-type antimicrobial peptide transport system permease subunit